MTKTAQQWIDGTHDDHGFVGEAGDESADAPVPRYPVTGVSRAGCGVRFGAGWHRSLS
ncbi:hypothetical protein ACIA6T_01965 [Streptomyces sp. NPDC051740]|uniref:hypothetical protein n=1 Tax=Streptomyces sp. NPDC051740 TaxID=3365673 RepID=UPI0037B8AFD9